MDVQEAMNARRCSPEEAIAALPKTGRIVIGANGGEPTTLVAELARQHKRFESLEVAELLSFRSEALVQPGMEDHIRVNALFIGPAVRAAVAARRADYTPVFLSEIPALFRPGGPLPLDAVLVQVSPPDAHGFCSLGVTVDVVRGAIDNAPLVIAEVNPQMPRTFGQSQLHISRFDKLVEVDHPLPTLAEEPGTVEEDTIGALVAELVEDGCTIQAGIGGIPNAVMRRLSDRKDLGVHTEMFSDGLMDLVEKGVITGVHKPRWKEKAVTSFILGSKRLYQWAHDNPFIEMQPSNIANDPMVIASHPNMVAINSALSIDLTGQVNADSIGTRFYSGIGGQVDFLRGAARSEGGKAILALPSTAKGGKLSKIVPVLAPGAGVVTSRGDVHYVVTEFGRVNLHGKTIRQRALAMISIAHPSFRDELTIQARELGLI